MTFDDFIEAIAYSWYANCEIETHLDLYLAYEYLDKGMCRCENATKQPHPVSGNCYEGAVSRMMNSLTKEEE